MRWGRTPPSTWAMVSGSVLSPQISRCFPSSQTSPGGWSMLRGLGMSSGSVRPAVPRLVRAAISSSAKPVSDG